MGKIEEITINYIHKNQDIPSQLADGAYCLASDSGNIVLNFFQQPPNIPEKMVYHDSEDIPPQKRQKDWLAEHDMPWQHIYGVYETEHIVERFFVGKISLTPDAARLLISNIQATLNDMEK